MLQPLLATGLTKVSLVPEVAIASALGLVKELVQIFGNSVGDGVGNYEENPLTGEIETSLEPIKSQTSHDTEDTTGHPLLSIVTSRLPNLGSPSSSKL